MQVTILYTQKKSIYKQLNCDCWDIDRNAKKWPGGNPIIAHPPCRAWGKLKHFANARTDEKNLTIHAVIMIRLWGGVLEHPSGSELWKTMNLPQPGKKDQYGGWTLHINQHWFGHRAQKMTKLYIVGINPKDIPEYPLNLNRPTTLIEHMNKSEREHTPKEFAIWLINLINQINEQQKRRLIA